MFIVCVFAVLKTRFSEKQFIEHYVRFSNTNNAKSLFLKSLANTNNAKSDAHSIDGQSVTFYDKTEHTFKGSEKRRPKAKFWVTGESGQSFEARKSDFEDVYNTVELLGDAEKAVACKKMWRDVENH